MQYLKTLEPLEEVCIINDIQKRGTTFPVSIKSRNTKIDSNALMGTGATRSCMNYNTAYKLGNNNIKQFKTTQVVGADGSNLGAVGTLQCKITIGDIEVEQTFIVCRHLRRNVILGTDLAKQNQAGISWTRQGTRILLVKGVTRLEVEEDELGIPVTTKYHVKVPLRYSAVFEMNANVFQHEISIKPDGNSYFPLVAVTNLDHAKMLHLAKGEIVGFAHDEEVEMNYIETSNVLEIGELEQRTPRNWIPERKWKNHRNYSEILPQQGEVSEITVGRTKKGEISPNSVEVPEEPAALSTLGKILHKKLHKTGRLDECNSEKDFETDFLISPGDVYLNRKVKLEDADITEETREKFEEMCDHHLDAFSKNNKDIGRTTLIEMEIDTGDSLPIAQNPYTLPLKHHEWVRKEIETLEKAGVIERSLSPWASPVIVVPKKSAPDEPPRRRL